MSKVFDLLFWWSVEPRADLRRDAAIELDECERLGLIARYR